MVIHQHHYYFFLMMDYEGGELIIADTIYKPKRNSAIIFPSNFMFPHSVNKIKKEQGIV